MLTRVSAVQIAFTYYSTPQEFADLARVQIERAAENGAELVLLPHLASLMLFGMFDFGAGSGDSLQSLAARQNMETAEWLEERAGYVHEFYLHVFQSLAERVERWLAPGTALEAEGDSLYLTAYLLNPAGEIVGRQRQMNPAPEHKSWGVRAGEELRVFETEIGDLGFVIGHDVNDREIGQPLVANGANLLLHPFAGTGKAVMQDAAGALAQATRTPVVRANLVGDGFSGLSGIYAPGDSTWQVLAQAATETDGEILFADVQI